MADDYGTDLDWGSDLAKDAGLVSGTELLRQAALHRLTTSRGSCFDSPDDGIDLVEFLHQGMTPAELASVPGQIRDELTKDERFLGATVALTQLQNGFDLQIRITPTTGKEFDLVLQVADAEVKLLGAG